MKKINKYQSKMKQWTKTAKTCNIQYIYGQYIHYRQNRQNLHTKPVCPNFICILAPLVMMMMMHPCLPVCVCQVSRCSKWRLADHVSRTTMSFNLFVSTHQPSCTIFQKTQTRCFKEPSSELSKAACIITSTSFDGAVEILHADHKVCS